MLSQKIKVDQDVVIYPRNHDGDVTELHLKGLIDEEQTFRLVWTLDNKTMSITVPQVSALQIDRFTYQNSLVELQIRRGDALHRDEVERLFLYPEEVVDKLKSMWALVMISSIGCKGIVLSRQDPTQWSCSQVPVEKCEIIAQR